MYYVHQSWERCQNRGLLESLGFSFPGSGFNALVKARDQYPSTHDRTQEAMKDLILDQDQHEGKSGAVGQTKVLKVPRLPVQITEVALEGRSKSL